MVMVFSKQKIKILFLIALVLMLTLVAFFLYNNSRKENEEVINQSLDDLSPDISNDNVVETPEPTTEPSSETVSQYGFPVAEFKERITKKSFGTYITPQNSPVKPERFSGYHTAVDVEFGDVAATVPVMALADGKITYSRSVDGYGGVFMMELDLNGAKHTAIYGHIKISSLPEVGRIVAKGEQIGFLGDAFSSDTDGERKHLHFGILSDSRIDFKGYVQNQSALSGWIDPLTLYQ